ncbi:hypothetical protein OB931_20975, partial [Aeromonas media]|uniref:hypothetical protein n=1 Tax=Aeromonas media TaxID=651 RepID=UPI00259F223B
LHVMQFLFIFFPVLLDLVEFAFMQNLEWKLLHFLIRYVRLSTGIRKLKTFQGLFNTTLKLIEGQTKAKYALFK